MAQPSLSEQIRRLEAELGVPLFARAGRRLELTEAGRLLRPARRAHAGRGRRRRRSPSARCATSPAAPSPSAPSAARTTTCSAASSRSSARAPAACACASSARTRPRSPTRCATGTLEAGLVVLPVDDRGLDVRPAMREELLYISRRPASGVREPMTIERSPTRPLILYDARWGAEDPTRRQLRERAQRAGVQIEPVIEVEYMTAALDLAARGLGDTVADRVDRRPRAARAAAHERRRSTRRCTRRSPSSPAATPTSRRPRARSWRSPSSASQALRPARLDAGPREASSALDPGR